MPTKKPQPSSAPDADPTASSEAANNIWLAGLGAFAKVQADGSKAFEALVRDGLAMQQKTQTLAQERLADATQRMEELTARASMATGRWGLESIFQDRVARALQGMEMPSPEDWHALQARVHALELAVAQLRADAHATPTTPPKKAPARKKV